MKILQNADPNYLRNIIEPSNTPQLSMDNAQAVSMMQRLDQLEKENSTLRDVLVQQQKSMLERMSDSESRIMSEVQRRVELEMEVRVKNKATDVGASAIEKRLAQMERIIESQQNEIAAGATLEENYPPPPGHWLAKTHTHQIRRGRRRRRW